VYGTFLIYLLLGGFGLPVPEELPVVMAGISASEGAVVLSLAFLTCYCGVLLADQIMFFAGLCFGARLLQAGARSPMLPYVTTQRVNDVRDGLRRHRLLFFLVCRHLIFLRPVTFVVAGTLRIPYLEFLSADAFAAFFSVMLFMGLGYFLGKNLDPEIVSGIVKQVNLILFLTLAAGIVLSVLFWLFRRRNRGAELTESSEPLP
jgi:membrane protein DedA with SNARE-associated domain